MNKHKGHHEGTIVTGQHDFNTIFPYIMKRRNDSVVYYSVDLDLEPLYAYMEKRRQEDVEIRFLAFTIGAIVRLLRERPQLNRFVKGRRIYQREMAEISLIAKREMADDGAETQLTLRFPKKDTFADIVTKLKGEVKTAKASSIEEQKEDEKVFRAFAKLPRFVFQFVVKLLELLDFYKGVPKVIRNVDPMRASVFVANLGSIGIEAPYHHLYEWGTCSIFAAIGKIEKKPVVLPDGKVGSKMMVNMKFSIDERITDGYYLARSLDLFKSYFEHPEKIEMELGMVKPNQKYEEDENEKYNSLN